MSARPARSLQRLASLLAIGVVVAACSDGLGPDAAGVRFHAVFPDGVGGLAVWRYEGWIGRQISPDSLPHARDFAEAPDGRMAYVTQLRDSDHRAIAEYASDGTPLRVIDVGAGAQTTPRDLAYSPDGSRLAWTSSPGGLDDSLFVLDAGSATPRTVASRLFREIVNNQVEILAPRMRWTPQGEIVFAPPRTLVALDPVSGATRPIVSDAGVILDYDFASDGRLAMCNVTTGSETRLLAQRVSGGPLVDVLPGQSFVTRRVRWSPDGTRLATIGPDTTYDGTNGGTTEGIVETSTLLLIVPADGGATTRNDAVRVREIVGWSGGGVVVVGFPVGSQLGEGDALLVPTRGRPFNLTRTPGIEEWVVKLRR